MDDHYTLRLDRDGQPLRPDRSPRAVLANYSEWIPEGWAWDPAGKLQVGCGGSAGMEEFARRGRRAGPPPAGRGRDSRPSQAVPARRAGDGAH